MSHVHDPVRGPVAPSTPSAPRARDPLYDGLRAAALSRVLLWHALAWPWLSWVFPAMPVMFFLAGSLLAASLGRGTWWRTALRRARRLLVPFWVFGAAVLTTTALTAHRSGDPLAPEHPLRWLVPLLPPVGHEAQQGWLTSHLWYVTDYLWLLVLAPLLLRCARRPGLCAAVALGGLAVLEVGPRAGLPTLSGGARTGVGDLLCYGLFAVLGASWARARRRPGRAPLLAAGALALVSAAALTLVVPLERGSLNSSWLLLALVALGWLCLLAVVQDPLRRLVAGPRAAALLRGVTARAVTIYLWHPAAIVLARTGVDEFLPGLRQRSSAPLVVLASLLLTLLAVVAVGWVEDLAGGRPVRWWPARRVVAAPRRRLPLLAVTGAVPVVAGCAALSVAFTGGPSPSLLAIPGPSDRSALARSAFARIAEPGVVLPTRAQPLDELPADVLQAVLDDWVARTDGVDAAAVGVASGAAVWDAVWEGTSSLAVGTGLAAGTPVPAASLTKGVTSALVLQEARRGTIDLDAPVPDLDGVPADGRTTPRDLLRHAGGLVQYADAPGYDPATTYTPAELVGLARAAPPLFEPGTAVHYSNSGFLWLGLLLEHVTGTGYADLVAQRIAAPLGLTTVVVDETPVPGWVGYSSGGVVASPGDLARWQGYLLESDLVLDPAARAELTDLAPLGNGLGIWPSCPCGTDAAGVAWAKGWGQVVNAGGAYAYPAEHVAVAAYLQPEGPRATETMPDLAEALLAVLPGRVDDGA
ncbi:CubicO group peptidase (beta-lactamase class C family)/peptidoglycan/LPS O-acetylase OafA/YrhL [Kineococcus radiotolerans]|uniref:CubicO group peptidase (Beta-lactamase class C family)/peptidoglycan/LPS O-acetylase OafA/YrhL n=1 Tax=Kineococcus radiotolerans TaxID=131568 RepID=A0A7W4XWT6_KINRA|nr:serine hydrolase domain-containing protein [Kineococcus radiotolerans]MBB2900465.1 CubicO group peptidase (beta-lactamase class C family)/peptidoglycan/LPS O-acetylase OafA/YrhL [Kineococcus radiotolerans]